MRRTFEEHDVHRILSIQAKPYCTDKKRWGFTSFGSYTSQSGYRLLEDIRDLQGPSTTTLSPLETRLWSNLWKTKTSPKLRHFLWRALSSALAVKERLHSRCINVETTCNACVHHLETICHVLFSCPLALEVWDALGLPLPPAGFSTNSVFLNLHYLIQSSRNRDINPNIRRIFPWILWHTWKARNLLLFEKTQTSGLEILSRAQEKAGLWFHVNYPVTQTSDPVNVTTVAPPPPPAIWQKPNLEDLKCNVGFSWINWQSNGGAAWILRNHSGNVLLHSRRAYSKPDSEVQAGLLSLLWATESMVNLHKKRVILEISSPVLRDALSFPDAYQQYDSLFTDLQNNLLLIDS